MVKTKAEGIAKTTDEMLAAIKSQTIFSGVVSLVSREKDSGEDFLLIKTDDWSFKIMKSELDADLEIATIVNFVGRKVYFIPVKIDEKEGVVYASRSAAQRASKESVVKRLEGGEVVSAQIINMLPHGAYVEIEGVTGLLKNTDYADDYSTIRERYKLGSYIKVKFKKYSSNGSIIFEAAKKYRANGALTIDELAPDQVVLGVVRAIHPFGVFVQVAVNLDALCSLDVPFELEEEMRVTVKLTEVIHDKRRVRGKILAAV